MYIDQAKVQWWSAVWESVKFVEFFFNKAEILKRKKKIKIVCIAPTEQSHCRGKTSQAFHIHYRLVLGQFHRRIMYNATKDDLTAILHHWNRWCITDLYRRGHLKNFPYTHSVQNRVKAHRFCFTSKKMTQTNICASIIVFVTIQSHLCSTFKEENYSYISLIKHKITVCCRGAELKFLEVHSPAELSFN